MTRRRPATLFLLPERAPWLGDHARRGRHRAVGGPRLTWRNSSVDIAPYVKAIDEDLYELALQVGRPQMFYDAKIAAHYSSLPQRYLTGIGHDDFERRQAEFMPTVEQTLRVAMAPDELTWTEHTVQPSAVVPAWTSCERESAATLFGRGASESQWWRDLWHDEDEPGKGPANEED